jgi:hypothetical protein
MSDEATCLHAEAELAGCGVVPVPEGILGWEPIKSVVHLDCRIRERTRRTIATKDTSSDTTGRTNACSASPRCRFLFARPFLTCGGKSCVIQNAWFERVHCCDADERGSEPAVPTRDGKRCCDLLSSARA